MRNTCAQNQVKGFIYFTLFFTRLCPLPPVTSHLCVKNCYNIGFEDANYTVGPIAVAAKGLFCISSNPFYLRQQTALTLSSCARTRRFRYPQHVDQTRCKGSAACGVHLRLGGWTHPACYLVRSNNKFILRSSGGQE